MSATAFTRAIVRRPTENFAAGLTSQTGAPPSFELALAQHAAYCAALERCGLSLEYLAPDAAHPDAAFVEDTAVLAGGRALVTRPGAPERAGEVRAVATALVSYFDGSAIAAIEAPGTLDGGDVCEADGRVYVGVSRRTNAEGARQLAQWLAAANVACIAVPMDDIDEILHLKSGIAYLGDGTFAIIEALRGRIDLGGDEAIVLDPQESYAANCIRVNGRVLVASGYPRFERSLRDRGFDPLSLDVSEYAKMDGGLSCLSLRF